VVGKFGTGGVVWLASVRSMYMVGGIFWKASEHRIHQPLTRCSDNAFRCKAVLVF